MKNRCGYCESKTKDIVCWECLAEMLAKLEERIESLERQS